MAAATAAAARPLRADQVQMLSHGCKNRTKNRHSSIVFTVQYFTKIKVAESVIGRVCAPAGGSAVCSRDHRGPADYAEPADDDGPAADDEPAEDGGPADDGRTSFQLFGQNPHT